MLKITVEKSRGVANLKLEGRLAGPWVHELELTWEAAIGDANCKSILVDLCSVRFIDAKAYDLLARICRHGAQFKTSGFLVKSIIEEITQGCERPLA